MQYKKVMILALFLFTLPLALATENCVLYDDFSSGSLDTNKWEVRQDIERQPLTDEHGVLNEGNGFVFHTQQNITGDRRTFLVPTINFTSGDTIKYTVDVVSKEGNYGNVMLWKGVGCSRCIGAIVGFNNGPSPSDQVGTTNVTIAFLDDTIQVTKIFPNNDTHITQEPFPDPSSSYELYIGTFVGSNGRVHLDYDNFVLCTTAPDPIPPTIEERVSTLEAWQLTTQTVLDNLQQWIQQLTLRLEAQDARINQTETLLDTQQDTLQTHENRIQALENNTGEVNATLAKEYLQYLPAADRKRIVCGYGADQHLAHYEDLGWSCDITYKGIFGRERINCKCDQVS